MQEIIEVNPSFIKIALKSGPSKFQYVVDSKDDCLMKVSLVEEKQGKMPTVHGIGEKAYPLGKHIYEEDTILLSNRSGATASSLNTLHCRLSFQTVVASKMRSSFNKVSYSVRMRNQTAATNTTNTTNTTYGTK